MKNKYSLYLKKINISCVAKTYIPISEIYAQYNYDRFKKWKSLYRKSERDILNMRLSPHYDFLQRYEKEKDALVVSATRYYKMHILYGKKKKWIRSKVSNFISLYQYMKENNEVGLPIILTSPIAKNKYNRGYEIYEGHHRVSILRFLNKEKIKVELSKWRET